MLLVAGKTEELCKNRGACVTAHPTYSHTCAKECIHVHMPMHHTGASCSFPVSQHSMHCQGPPQRAVSMERMFLGPLRASSKTSGHAAPAAGRGWTLLPSCPHLQNQQRLMSFFKPKTSSHPVEQKTPSKCTETTRSAQT